MIAPNGSTALQVGDKVKPVRDFCLVRLSVGPPIQMLRGEEHPALILKRLTVDGRGMRWHTLAIAIQESQT